MSEKEKLVEDGEIISDEDRERSLVSSILSVHLDEDEVVIDSILNEVGPSTSEINPGAEEEEELLRRLLIKQWKSKNTFTNGDEKEDGEISSDDLRLRTEVEKEKNRAPSLKSRSSRSKEKSRYSGERLISRRAQHKRSTLPRSPRKGKVQTYLSNDRSVQGDLNSKRNKKSRELQNFSPANSGPHLSVSPTHSIPLPLVPPANQADNYEQVDMEVDARDSDDALKYSFTSFDQTDVSYNLIPRRTVKSLDKKLEIVPHKASTELLDQEDFFTNRFSLELIGKEKELYERNCEIQLRMKTLMNELEWTANKRDNFLKISEVYSNRVCRLRDDVVAATNEKRMIDEEILRIQLEKVDQLCGIDDPPRKEEVSRTESRSSDSTSPEYTADDEQVLRQKLLLQMKDQRVHTDGDEEKETIALREVLRQIFDYSDTAADEACAQLCVVRADYDSFSGFLRRLLAMVDVDQQKRLGEVFSTM